MNVQRRFFICAVIATVLFGVSSANAKENLKDEDCLACHSDASLTHEVNGKSVSLFVDQNKLKHSIHGSMFTCVDCHKDVKSLAHEKPPQKITCEQCHADAQQAWAHSVHAQASRLTGSPAATCEDCHSNVHTVVTADDPASPVAHANIPNTCGKCHSQKFLMESNGLSAQTFFSYQESVHGRAVQNGSQKAAVCTDCHGSHGILPASQVQSPIYKLNVPNTCGKCHVDVKNTFNVSVHGQALARGNSMAPACTDCHGIHTIKSHTDPKSPTAAANLSRDTCASCHEGVRLSQEFGVPGGKVTSYFDSYHGLATEGGSVVAANCASCHGVHDILPSSDPRSTINPAHLQATCGKCHQGVNAKFTQTPVHLQVGVRPTNIDSLAVRIVRWIYIPLIIIVIGAMFLHNAIMWRSKTATLHRVQNPKMTRMSVNQRCQHLTLLVSFIILVITGFALKFPESWYAHTLGMGEHLRGIIHRVAGVVLLVAGIYHMFYVASAREGRRLLRDLMPRPRDIVDAWTTMGYYLGLSKEKPKYGRFNYAEKAEYWSLVWGTVLMGLTGIMMWAKVWVGNLVARMWIDVATSIHYYEAILAALAIVVWHFYQIFFDPDVYPMNWAWLDGKMPIDYYKHEHELDTESLEKEKNE